MAQAVARALEHERPEVAVGGPEVLTWDQIAILAGAAAGRRTVIVHVLRRLVKAALPALRLTSRRTSRRLGGL